MKRVSFIVVLAFVFHIATAGTPTLVPFKGANVSVSFPKGWIVQQQSGLRDEPRQSLGSREREAG